MLKKLFAVAVAFTGLLSVSHCIADRPNMTPETEMIQLIGEIQEYAQKKNSHFQIIGNGAAGLLEETPTNSNTNVERLISYLDGFLTESVYYEQNTNGQTKKQPQSYVTYLRKMFAKPKAAGKAIWTLDYMDDLQHQYMDEKMGRADGYVSMALSGIQLDTIPKRQVPFANTNDIYRVQEAQNFLFLLNPGAFPEKAIYLESLRKTAYDVIIIDLYYGDSPLTKEDVDMLKIKPQGGTRMVMAYMSVGEAADYRPYWKEEWNQKRPSWICDPNPNWPGSYKVQYWMPQWKHILYGNDKAYLDTIIAADFDGVFLDVIDAWQYFVKK